MAIETSIDRLSVADDGFSIELSMSLNPDDCDQSDNLKKLPDLSPAPDSRRCEGWLCYRHDDVRWDKVSARHLCPGCWPKIDPRKHGFTQHE